MLRPAVLALAATLVAAPALAQSAAPPASGPAPAQTGQTTDDGTSAMAQQDQSPGPDTGTLLIGGVMVGWTAMVGVLIANAENKSNNPVSP